VLGVDLAESPFSARPTRDEPSDDHQNHQCSCPERKTAELSFPNDLLCTISLFLSSNTRSSFELLMITVGRV
jgi:hypothetical protein